MANLSVLAIDLGASGGRGIIGSYNGNALSLNEIHRFPNDPVFLQGTLHWDILRILHEIKTALGKCARDIPDLTGIGIDTWGVDYGLLDSKGRLLSNPVHYRDSRTSEMQQYAFSKMPREKIYAETGLQFMDFNTLFQLLAEVRAQSPVWQAAHRLLFTPDLLNYFLTGEQRTEYTIASTSQLLDAQSRTWASDILDTFGIPKHLFGDIVMPGKIVGPLHSQIQEEVGVLSAKITAVASHDTASAVAAVPASDKDYIFISCGTWALLGTESDTPMLSGEAMSYELSNEGSYSGIQLLRNIMGLWLLQESKRQWEREGQRYTYDELSALAESAPPLRSLINPEDSLFSAPGDLPSRIRQYCKETGQPVPENPGAVVRCIFESLALCFRRAMDGINHLKQKNASCIHIVGGGAREPLLCRFAADACSIPVYAGPVEATAIGNIAVQAIAAGELSGLGQARELIKRSFAVTTYTPSEPRSPWDDAYGRFLELPNVKI